MTKALGHVSHHQNTPTDPLRRQMRAQNFASPPSLPDFSSDHLISSRPIDLRQRSASHGDAGWVEQRQAQPSRKHPTISYPQRLSSQKPTTQYFSTAATTLSIIDTAHSLSARLRPAVQRIEKGIYAEGRSTDSLIPCELGKISDKLLYI